MNFDRRRALKIMATLAACPLCNAGAFAAGHWSYEGADGPDHWGDLDAASKVCATGSQQSPINIESPIQAKLPPLKIQWAKSADTIVNNGHTIQLNLAPGSTLTLGDDEYKLVQFHFHRPSEHLINGALFPMETHFVHQDSSGKLAVVGVLMSAGKENSAFNKVVTTMPAKEGPAVKADPAIEPEDFLPGNLDYCHYKGSLTTPPCAETVAWLLLIEPIEVSEADVARFAKLYEMNARPVQKYNRRFVLKSG